jgi:polar amino acid transport system substrate-binding protein/two-component system sensor histidine kinase EvgS
MVVDDVADNRTLIKASFADSNVHVLEAVHGQDAIEQLANARVDLMLMDLRMPVLNGYDATRRLRRTRSMQELPIVALTASVLADDLSQIEQYGFNGYLQKPVEKKRLLREVARFLPSRASAPPPCGLDESLRILSAELRDAAVADLENDLLTEWKAVQDKGDIQLIQHFSEQLSEIAAAREIGYLKDYATRLATCVAVFDLSEIFETMSRYPDVIEKIRKAEVENNVRS